MSIFGRMRISHLALDKNGIRRKGKNETPQGRVSLIDKEGKPIPQNRQEELQMRFHLTPHLYHDLPAGLHNN